jgi:hypothetical protein
MPLRLLTHHARYVSMATQDMETVSKMGPMWTYQSSGF